MNNEQIDVARRILELADSAKEGLDYAISRSREGDYASAIHVLTDVVAAFAQIEEALPIVELAEDGPVREAGVSLQEGFRHFLERSEAPDHAMLVNVMDLTLLPRYEEWHRMLIEALRPHLVS